MLEQVVRWNTYARIAAGEYEGWYVMFVDDSKGETGGAYVLLSQTMGQGGEAYDDWLQRASDTVAYIREQNWTLDYVS